MWKNNKKRSCLPNRIAKIYHKGITLIELLIAVAIIGILASLSAPSYFNYVRQGEISDSLSTLSILASRMESEYLNNRNYGIAVCSVGDFPGPNGTFYTCRPDNNGQGYEWTAASLDYSYSLDNFGNRTTNSFPNLISPTPNCWHKSATAGDCF